MMFIAGTRRRDFRDSSHVRTPAQSRAEIESPRARGPHTAGSEFSPATELRAAALQSKQTRFLAAYGPHRPRAAAPLLTSSTKSPAPATDRRRDTELPIALTSVAKKITRSFQDPSYVRPHSQSRAHLGSLRYGHSINGKTRFASDNSAAHRCAPIELRTLPSRLRRRTDYTLTPYETVATTKYRSHEHANCTATIQQPFITCHLDSITLNLNTLESSATLPDASPTHFMTMREPTVYNYRMSGNTERDTIVEQSHGQRQLSYP